MRRTVILHLDIERVTLVGGVELAPRPDRRVGVFAPVRPREIAQESLLVRFAEIDERQLPGGAVHHPRVVPEVPALDDVGHAEVAQDFIFAVQHPRDGDKGHGRHFVRTAHLHLRGEPAMPFRRLRHAPEAVGRPRRLPVVAAGADLAGLHLLAAAFAVVGEDDPGVELFRQMVGPFAVLFAPRLVEPAQELGVGIHVLHAPDHRVEDVPQNVPHRALTARARTVVLSEHVERTQARGRPLAERNEHEPAQMRHGAEEAVRRLIQVVARRFGVDAERLAVPHAARTDPFRVVGRRRILRAPVSRFDRERPHLDAVPAAALDGPAEFGAALFGARVLREIRRRADLAEDDREPDAVHAVAGEFLQVFLRVIVDVVGELVVIERRPLDRAEETARNAVLEPRRPHDRRRFGRDGELFHQFVHAAPDALGGRAFERDAVFVRRDPPRFAREVAALPGDDREIARDAVGVPEALEVEIRGLEQPLRVGEPGFEPEFGTAVRRIADLRDLGLAQVLDETGFAGRERGRGYLRHKNSFQ